MTFWLTRGVEHLVVLSRLTKLYDNLAERFAGHRAYGVEIYLVNHHKSP